jgi:predicted O-methyltransferase YrrM
VVRVYYIVHNNDVVFLFSIFILILSIAYRKVLEDDPTEEATKVFKSLNDFIRDDSRVDISMLAVGDGVTFCYKK